MPEPGGVNKAWRRLEERDILRFNRVRARWEDACKVSFGPLPAIPEAQALRDTVDFDATARGA